MHGEIPSGNMPDALSDFHETISKVVTKIETLSRHSEKEMDCYAQELRDTAVKVKNDSAYLSEKKASLSSDLRSLIKKVE